jgi:IS4 transposase
MINLNGRNKHELENVLNKMFSPDWLRDTATRVGFIKRSRKIDPVAFFWVVVLGFGAGVQRTLADLRRAYKAQSAETIVPSSFYDRFSQGLVEFLRECLHHGIAELCNHASLTLSDKLHGFKDIVVSDGTIVKLHEKLANNFPGTRHKAELKIHVATGITSNSKTIAMYSGNTPEIKTMRIGPWIENNILLFDLGYYKHELFGRIIENGGYFVSRLKQTSNPTIISVLHAQQGSTKDFANKKFKEILPNLTGDVIDLQIEISFKSSRGKKKDPQDTFETYQPRGSQPKATESLRLVAILNKTTGEYHSYLTNITSEQLSAEDVAQLYRARWSIELLFKELKSLYKLDVIKSGAPVVVESLVLVAMLTLVVSQRLLNHVRSLAPEIATRFTNLRWGKSFFAVAPIIMGRILKVAGIPEDPIMLLLYIMNEGVDPNFNHAEPLMTPWVKPVNSQGIKPIFG